jgi:two-component system phosphate regulon sensor histidine kinase PhoR
LHNREAFSFYDKFNHFKDSTGKIPKKNDLLEFYYVQKNPLTKQTIIYSNSIISEDFKISSGLFDKKSDKKFGGENVKSFNSKRITEVYNNNSLDNSGLQQSLVPDNIIKKSGSLDILNNAQFEIFYKDFAAAMPLQERISKEDLMGIIKN